MKVGALKRILRTQSSFNHAQIDMVRTKCDKEVKKEREKEKKVCFKEYKRGWITVDEPWEEINKGHD